MSKISQRDAQQLRKRVRELEVEEDRRRNSWSDVWPGGVEITRITAPAETVMGVRGPQAEARRGRDHRIGWRADSARVAAGEGAEMTDTKDRLAEALRYYANPEIYKPHPHGSAFDRRDLSATAREALAAHDAQRAESGAGVDEYEFEVRQDDYLQAGGSASDARTALGEADHYAEMYSADGPVELKFYARRQLTREQMEAAAPEKDHER